MNLFPPFSGYPKIIGNVKAKRKEDNDNTNEFDFKIGSRKISTINSVSPAPTQNEP